MGDDQKPALARSVVDPSAFDQFYVEHAKRMLVFFTRRTLDAEVALDLTAETFAQAYAGRTGFRGTTEEQAAGWLYAIAHRRLARYLRKGYAERAATTRLGLELPPPQAEELEHIHELAGSAHIRRALADSLSGLPEEQRQALVMRVVEERSYAEVADRLAITEQAARARVSRALRTLRPLLAPLAEGEAS
jgi:RNA polymerase sigma-70 factor (ECF subfamily)